MTGTASVLGVGLYSIRDASRYAEMRRGVVAGWAGLLDDDERFERLDENAPPILTFDDLISLLVVRDLYRAGVKLSDIKKAERFLVRHWRVRKPFATGRIKTGYGMVLTALKEGEQPVAISDAAQEIFYELIKKDVRDLRYSTKNRAHEWRPAPHIIVRPDTQWGQPCVEGTRVTTATIYDFVLAGERLEDLAEEHDISLEKIRAAYDWEGSLRRAA